MFDMEQERFYTEWSSHVPIAVVDSMTKKRFWFEKLDEEHKLEALQLRAYDINRKRFVHDGGRYHAFVMHRKYLKV